MTISGGVIQWPKCYNGLKWTANAYDKEWGCLAISQAWMAAAEEVASDESGRPCCITSVEAGRAIKEKKVFR